MEIKKMPFSNITQFSKRDTAYQLHPEQFASFIEDIPTLENLKKKVLSRQNFELNRTNLVNHLKSQYSNIDTPTEVKKNINLLEKNNSFTVATAHQPSLFTGPLYYIFKILSTLRLSEILNEKYPDINFIPCFISGGEDHDFEEINHTYLFGKEITWESSESGSCGRFSLAGLDKTIEQLENILGSSVNAEELKSCVQNVFKASKTYGDFTLRLANYLFGDMGLVILNMDTPELKMLFKDLIKEEIINSFSAPLVNQQIEKLNSLGFKAQASPRDINFFYLKDNLRERIILENKIFKILNTEITFTNKEILLEIENHPERFSPNVITRPLYQERILPNIAYIGGGGEIAYWLERKTQFAEAKVSFPILIRRNSAGVIDAKRLKVWNDLGFDFNQLASDPDEIKKQFTMSQNALPDSFLKGKKETSQIFAQIIEDIKSIDTSLSKSVMAEAQKNKKSFEQIEGKLLRFYKQKEETNLNRITKVQNYLFPNGSLQERRSNFMEFYLKEGKPILHKMKRSLNPLEKDFTLFVID